MNDKRLKIFVSAYACEPNLGSEIGVGWHWVLEMSKYFDLWVLTRESNRASIEGWLAENKLENIPNFIYYDLPPKWRFWKKGLRGVRLYYMLWQRLTNSIVKSVMQQNDISIYHLLTYGNALWPISSYGQKQTFIWGPTTAGSSVSSEFSRHYGFKSRCKEWAQRFMAKSLKFNYGFNSRCRDAKLILCKTEQTRLSIPEKYRHKAKVFTDVAVDMFDTSAYTSKREDEFVKYLMVGRLEAWRGFDLLIEAFAIAVKQNDKLRLDILGKGVDRERIEKLIEKHNLQQYISLRGQVSMNGYYQYMADCDAVINPTLKEGAVTTAFDSLSFAKPLICINTGGYTNYFDNNYAIVLPQNSNRTKVIESIANSIIKLTSPSEREMLQHNIISVRDNFTWERKGEHIRDIILKRVNE